MFSVTQQLVAPAVAQWGTDEQRERYVRAMLRTDLIACQLFSETEAGSDLAAVRTRAVERDGHWVLDGHKVWTSGAPVADLGVAVTRTDPAAAKHAGLTVFLVPMDTPGVTVRPIRQMTGGSSFNEVYLDGVELADDLRLGPVGEGWKVALTVLAAERLDSGNLGLANADRAVELARHLGRPLTELERDRVADLVTRSYVQRLTGHARGRRGRLRARPGTRGLGGQAARHRHDGPDVRGRPDAARTAARGRRRRLGHLGVDRAPARRSGLPHRRRHRRDPAQHHRRARPRPAAGATGMTTEVYERELCERVAACAASRSGPTWRWASSRGCPAATRA